MASVQQGSPSADPSLVHDEDRLLQRNWGWILFRGILALGLGIIALLFPLSAIFTFTLVFAAFAFVDGLFSLISGILGATRKEERWGSLIFRGIIGLIVGALFFFWPIVSTFSYALLTVGFVAAWAIITGVLELSAAIRLRKQITGEFWLGLAGALSILLGIAIVVMMMANPAMSLISAAWIIGIWALISGIALIALALRLRRERVPAAG